jgi:L-seryl-tRNA(Ser) seleniumtransferase
VPRGTDPERIERLPDTTGMRNSCSSSAAAIHYDQALRTAGAGWSGRNAERCTGARSRRRSGRTAALLHRLAPARQAGCRPPDGRLAHAHGLPLVVDAASTLPPVGHLTRWTALGADLAIYSGGKGIRGPQNTGLLLGRADLTRGGG